MIVGSIFILCLVGIWWLAARSDDQNSDTQNQSATLPQEPEAFDPSLAEQDTIEYVSKFNTSLKVSYPINWNLTEGTDNSAEQQIVTFESPKDANNFYFCLDLTELGIGSNTKLETTGASLDSVDDFTASGVGKSLNSVIFSVSGNTNLLWSIVDTKPQLDGSEFANQIVNPMGRRLQTLGRFNCRETESPDISSQQFIDSRWYADARQILQSLAY